MTIVIGIEFIGGLGNAFFQFGFIYSLAKKHACQFTITNLDTWSSPHQTVSYDWFKTMIRRCDNFVPSFNSDDYTIYTETHPFLYENIKVLEGNTLFRGYYQCWSCIDSSVYTLIYSCLPICDSNCDTDNTIFIHVRLGDYTKIPEAGLKDGYYTRALALFSSGIRFRRNNFREIKIHVFSDDIVNAKHIVPNADKYIDADEVTSLVYMTKYKLGGICANSSFSWWASQLNPFPCKTIVMPLPWGKILPDQPIDLYPPNVYKV